MTSQSRAIVPVRPATHHPIAGQAQRLNASGLGRLRGGDSARTERRSPKHARLPRGRTHPEVHREASRIHSGQCHRHVPIHAHRRRPRSLQSTMDNAHIARGARRRPACDADCCSAYASVAPMAVAPLRAADAATSIVSAARAGQSERVARARDDVAGARRRAAAAASHRPARAEASTAPAPTGCGCCMRAALLSICLRASRRCGRVAVARNVRPVSVGPPPRASRPVCRMECSPSCARA
jgi:hypothetical protein